MLSKKLMLFMHWKVSSIEYKEYIHYVAVTKDCIWQTSIMSDSLQKSDVSLIDVNYSLQHTGNRLEKIKLSVPDGKYSFDEVARNDGFYWSPFA